MHTHDEAIPTQLIRDLFNPALTAFDLCDRHGLTLDRLAELLESPAMDRVAARLDAITRRRTELLAPRARLAALGRLAELAAAVPEDRRHAEAVRRAAVVVERATRPTTPRRTPKPTTEPPAPPERAPTPAPQAAPPTPTPQPPRRPTRTARSTPPPAQTLRARVGAPAGCC